MSGSEMRKMTGGCHCRAVRYEIAVPEDFKTVACNCSICTMTGFLHLIVPASRFRLLRGQNDLTTYTFNTGIARHYFCKHCGIKSFYVPRSNPDGFSINVRCLDAAGELAADELFDGRNWEANADKLAHLSRESSED